MEVAATAAVAALPLMFATSAKPNECFEVKEGLAVDDADDDDEEEEDDDQPTPTPPDTDDMVEFQDEEENEEKDGEGRLEEREEAERGVVDVDELLQAVGHADSAGDSFMLITGRGRTAGDVDEEDDGEDAVEEDVVQMVAAGKALLVKVSTVSAAKLDEVMRVGPAELDTGKA
jgi:hypothetical protein